MVAISAFGVMQHSQIFSLLFGNRIQCIALYQLHNSQVLLNLRRCYYSHACTLIDRIYYLFRNNRMQIASGNLMTDMSDHFADFIILHSNIKSRETDRPMIRIYSEQNKHTF